MNQKIECGIEQHAVLFALLAKYASEANGENGEKAILAGVVRYGNERGQRMAARALANGDSVDDIINFFAYTEWKPLHGQMEMNALVKDGKFVQHYTKCAWNNAWTKYKLNESGKLYCVSIDHAVLEGFNPKLHLNVSCNLSWGAPYCEFDWQLALTDADQKRLAAKKEVLGMSCVKNFNYHTGHLLQVIQSTLNQQLGQPGQIAVDQALAAYSDLFGVEYLSVLETEFEL